MDVPSHSVSPVSPSPVSVDQLNVASRAVFLRVDFNVPRNSDGTLLDDTRIREALPTIQHLLRQKSKVILASHLGRPKGHDKKDSLLNVAERLAALIDQEVIFPEDCVGDAVRKLCKDLREGEIILLENLRFHPEEEANNPSFAETLSKLAEVYVTDAFGTLHREHASTHGMVHHFKEKGIGFLVQKELKFLDQLLHQPQKPFVAVLGGAKVSDKIELIDSLVSKVDTLLLGGGLSYTFLKAKGVNIGDSRFESEKIHTAQKILDKADSLGVSVILPRDHRAAPALSPDATAKIVTELSEGQKGLDVGPETEKEFAEHLSKARTIFWNGPLGVFEHPAFAEGTKSVAKAIAEASKNHQALSVVGGGESLAAVATTGLSDQISHLSTGGGATLEYLEGRGLPGLKVLL